MGGTPAGRSVAGAWISEQVGDLAALDRTDLVVPAQRDRRIPRHHVDQRPVKGGLGGTALRRGLSGERESRHLVAVTAQQMRPRRASSATLSSCEQRARSARGPVGPERDEDAYGEGVVDVGRLAVEQQVRQRRPDELRAERVADAVGPKATGRRAWRRSRSVRAPCRGRSRSSSVSRPLAFEGRELARTKRTNRRGGGRRHGRLQRGGRSRRRTGAGGHPVAEGSTGAAPSSDEIGPTYGGRDPASSNAVLTRRRGSSSPSLLRAWSRRRAARPSAAYLSTSADRAQGPIGCRRGRVRGVDDEAKVLGGAVGDRSAPTGSGSRRRRFRPCRARDVRRTMAAAMSAGRRRTGDREGRSGSGRAGRAARARTTLAFPTLKPCGGCGPRQTATIWPSRTRTRPAGRTWRYTSIVTTVAPWIRTPSTRSRVRMSPPPRSGRVRAAKLRWQRAG